MKPVTIRDVARLAGVSTATVSRALGQPEKLNRETLDHVLGVVKQVGFVANAQARSFRQQSTQTIILLVRDISNPFYLEIYKGIEEVASETGYKVLMADARNDEARISNYIDMVRQRQADGLILMVRNLPADIDQRPGLTPPMVVASEAIPDVDLPTVRIDNAAAAKNAVDYLIAQGHRKIAHIGGVEGEYLAINRHTGYLRALREADLPVDPRLTVWGDFSIEAGRRGAQALLDTGLPFTAVLAASDQMAIGAISQLRRAGLRVPSDVSVIGFDDILVAQAFEPALTTVQQPRLEMGRAAMRLLVNLLSGTPSAPVHEFETKLIVRDSVAPVSAPEGP
ncbi:LacI family DNA-binding transcriptional regulator [Ketogulonicigenium vulgare]|uniref:DNA-binding transcriptional regulator CytR n=1 Tax=Ketogulonicigenium vulgare (strain WSH-001) TaxID=759362 RepID=F9Y7P4_KETVW|nr:LacI family DNA-binding transcriptional regulator [Ketogulonicigenium vulgare]ADO41619.1 LacI family transcriptional regulator [Ketogulonicigenium vulgare Y25]AEM39860.1 DNA-binding transcriptional regulator CytR [Ketogulonicigenium vulgare WSH-001]ALJ80075.1 transcriptional regulator [Ketogulonicigenium vulgare]ANW32952.1 transcriptional regulator [Ketogulonicigenium vulgare]AOZ53550.1 LacI family transcriptional regulator [Ketogulonicigenium vulgare]